jgi:hypothetical protein
MVVTKIAFELESPTPKLTFKPIGLLSEEAFTQVAQVASSDVVKNILGPGFTTEPAEPAEKAIEQAKATSKAVYPAITPKEPEAEPVEAKPAPKAKAKVAEVDVSGLNLDDLNFDD